ncbi:RNA polymerase II mediator complex subunit Soh1, partial [Aspergillus brunneoviolaceus CBS 621.78]
QQPPPPTLTNPRFTLELEFVSSLANPYYLSHLAVNYPNLLGISQSTDETDATDTKDTTTPRDPDAAAFAAYLAYLYSYWKTPEYAQFLTHPGATLRALRLLQEANFRRDVIRPDVVEALASNGLQEQVVEGDKPQGEEQQQDQSEQQDGK